MPCQGALPVLQASCLQFGGLYILLVQKLQYVPQCIYFLYTIYVYHCHAIYQRSISVTLNFLFFNIKSKHKILINPLTLWIILHTSSWRPLLQSRQQGKMKRFRQESYMVRFLEKSLQWSIWIRDQKEAREKQENQEEITLTWLKEVAVEKRHQRAIVENICKIL